MYKVNRMLLAAIVLLLMAIIVLLIRNYEPTAQTVFARAQTLFSCLLFIYFIRQTRIMEGQSNINARQTLLVESAHNFNVLIENIRILEKQREMPDGDEKRKIIEQIVRHSERLHDRNVRIATEISKLPIT